ncbi:MAG: phosphoribosylformylglycinamidine cyclo-ligase [Candidatus Obscuribacterales bacterium]|jgi:phosphoribosylformylglycinamidine cyclo-ligase|nr:phosphoribosylformylglycinamidine cyclo-ligase [Candidatus Obscuribacterales bacterium]
MKKETYSKAGVQIEKAEGFVDRIKLRAKRPGHEKMWKGAGGYAAIQEVAPDLGIAVTTDGVGTKLLVANELKRHDTIGIDLVAMVANDLICVGATPTMFLDYYAVGHLEDELSDAIIAGILEGCDQAGMILAGGETAEMPGLYSKGHYDLAGFAIGTVQKSRLITGDKIKPGQKLIGVASNGIHSNGLSLARKVVPKPSWDKLLEPTAIYVKAAVSALNKYHRDICGIANITGGGWRNMLRLNEKVGFHIDHPLPVPKIFQMIGESVDTEEMYKTFNMGLGLAIIAKANDDAIVSEFASKGHFAQVIGTVTGKSGEIEIDGFKFTLKSK